jgi:hypothetical protein
MGQLVFRRLGCGGNNGGDRGDADFGSTEVTSLLSEALGALLAEVLVGAAVGAFSTCHPLVPDSEAFGSLLGGGQIHGGGTIVAAVYIGGVYSTGGGGSSSRSGRSIAGG